jgi:hypothetical protein
LLAAAAEAVMAQVAVAVEVADFAQQLLQQAVVDL